MLDAQPLDLWSQRVHVYAGRKPMGRQLKAVYEVMLTGRWLTFRDIQDDLFLRGIGISEPGVSARIRDLRKREYGAHTIERRKTGRPGVHEYRMTR